MSIKTRWISYQMLSLMIAAACMFLTWRTGDHWTAQPWLVPVWTGLVPVFQYQWFISGNPKLTQRGRRRKVIEVFVGTILVQIMYVWLVFGGVIDWPWAVPILVCCGVVQAGAIVWYVFARRTDCRDRTRLPAAPA